MREMSRRHYRQVVNLVKTGKGSCIVCGRAILFEDLNNTVITLLDNKNDNVVHNMALRHATCTRSRYRPLRSGQDTVVLIEHMIASAYKLCPVCKKSWVSSEIEELALVEKGGKKDVAHLVCIGHDL